MQPRNTRNKEMLLGRCGIPFCSCDVDDVWYIDSRCSHHISGDRRNFHFPNKTKDGHVYSKVMKPLEHWEVEDTILVRRGQMQKIFGSLKA